MNGILKTCSISFNSQYDPTDTKCEVMDMDILHLFTNSKKDIEFVNERRILRKNEVYRHFKGGLYIVDEVARHSETGEEMVIYRSLKTGELWVRPKSMFMDIKQTEEGYTFRFFRHHFDA